MKFSEKLLSRKLWLAAAAATALFAAGAYSEVATVVVAYIAVQAGVDGFESYTNSKSESE